MEKYVQGTNNVTKYAIGRHLKAIPHQVALELQGLTGEKIASASAEVAGGSGECPIASTSQPRIDDSFHRIGTEAYRKLLTMAYLLAQGGLPLSSFETVVKCSKAAGAKLITGTMSGKTAREFTHYIADAIREKLALLVCSKTFFSVLSDGSQARKTGKEKELVLIRVIRSGVPVYYGVALEDISEYGDPTADNLKLSIDHTFKDKLHIDDEHYTTLMVSATSDGASVNTGKYNGLLVQLERSSRPWLVKIHCVSHRLELALKDSLLKEKSFTDIKDLMITLYYLFKQSGKLRGQFESLGRVSGVTIYTFPKVHGTRFIGHQRRGLHHLLNNWGILMQLCENCISSREKGYRNIKAKLQGILKKLKNFIFLSNCAFYFQLLENLSKFSLTLERGRILIFEVPLLIQTTTSENEDLLADQSVSDLLESISIHLHTDDGGNILNVIWKLPKSGHNRRLSANREYADVVVSRSQWSHVNDGNDVGNVNDQARRTTVSAVMKNRIVEEVNRCLNARFESFNDDFFQNMTWMDPANWTGTAAELEMMTKVATHFAVPLQFVGFVPAALKKEWPKLKNTVRFFYNGVHARKVWQRIFTYRRQEFGNVCLLVEIILCLGPSNSIVEKGFSQLTAMLSDRRLCLRPDSMEDLLLIKINHLSWTPAERDEIIDMALNKYMAKRRKLRIDNTPFNLLGLAQAGQKRKHHDSDSDSGDDLVLPAGDQASGGIPDSVSEPEESESESDDDDCHGQQSEPESDDNEEVVWERLIESDSGAE